MHIARTIQTTTLATAALACCAAIASGHPGLARDPVGDAPSGQPDVVTLRYGHYPLMCFAPVFRSRDGEATFRPDGIAEARVELFLDTDARTAGPEFVVTKRGTGRSQLRRLPGRHKVGRAIEPGNAAICLRRKLVGVPDSAYSTDLYRWRLRYLSADGQVGDRLPDHGYCKHSTQHVPDCGSY
jgi:hypothetical protein